MPLLSLPVPPLPFFGLQATGLQFPIRVPLPMLRIGSILPSSLNGPLKESLLALFNLAWSNKVQLPVLITVAFLALDVRLQMEINIFWEPPRRRQVQEGNSHFRQAAALLQRNREREMRRLQQIEQLRSLRRELLTRQLGMTGDVADEEETETEDAEVDTDSVPDLTAMESSQGHATATSRGRRKIRAARTRPDGEDSLLSSSSEEEDGEDELDSNSSEEEEVGSEIGGAYQWNRSEGEEGLSDEESEASEDSGPGVAPLVLELEIRQR